VAERSEPVINFSVEELLALCAVLGVGSLPTLGIDPLGDIDARLHAILLEAATRSLAARGVVDWTDDAPVVIGSVAALVRLVAAPALLVTVLRDGMTSEARSYAADPDLSVEHAALAGIIHRLTPFSTSDLLVRMLRFAGLADRPVNAAAPLTVSRGVLLDSLQRAADGMTDEATKLLEDAGASPSSARAFITAVDASVASVSVGVLHRPAETSVEGGELSWIDGVAHGLWTVPILLSAGADDAAAILDSDAPATVAPVPASSIAETLLSYLPSS
jgi:hypothetical protein